MRCPICGAGVKNEECPYCKITNKQIMYASNKQAKELIKEHKDKDNVHYSNVTPKDVNRVKVWLFTFLGGWYGADSFLTGKYYKGWFSLITYLALYITTFFKVLAEMYSWGANAYQVFSYLQSFFTIFGVITFMFWFVGMISLLTKKYKYPVVLRSEQESQRMYLDEQAEKRNKEIEKANKRNNNG